MVTTSADPLISPSTSNQCHAARSTQCFCLTSELSSPWAQQGESSTYGLPRCTAVYAAFVSYIASWILKKWGGVASGTYMHYENTHLKIDISDSNHQGLNMNTSVFKMGF